MKIDITQKHIDEGDQKNPSGCAIARALREQGAKDIRVIGSYAQVDGELFRLDVAGHRFVMKFDRLGKKYVSPITVTLSPYFPTADGVRDWEDATYAIKGSSIHYTGFAN